MPRGKSAPVSAGEGDNATKPVRRAHKDDEWGGFVPTELDSDGREGFELWFSSHLGSMFKDLDDCLGTGLKFTLSYDGANQCYIASLSGRPDVDGVQRFTNILTGRADTFERAIGVLVYKHVEVLRFDWWTVVNAPKVNRRRFG